MRRTLLVTALATALAGAVAMPAFADAPPPPGPGMRAGAHGGPGGPGGARREEMRARVQQKVQAFLTTELQSRVGLDATKSAKLSDAIQAHMERKHARAKQLREEMKKLRGLVDGKASDAQIKAQLDRVLGASSRDDDAQAFIGDTSKFLSVQEQAKLALALPDVLKEVHHMMRSSHREMRGGRGGFGGRGPADDED